MSVENYLNSFAGKQEFKNEIENLYDVEIRHGHPRSKISLFADKLIEAGRNGLIDYHLETERLTNQTHPLDNPNEFMERFRSFFERSTVLENTGAYVMGHTLRSIELMLIYRTFFADEFVTNLRDGLFGVPDISVPFKEFLPQKEEMPKTTPIPDDLLKRMYASARQNSTLSDFFRDSSLFPLELKMLLERTGSFTAIGIFLDRYEEFSRELITQ
ncbi:MAG: hypothetical protein M1308_19700 [Actinobacteria bacterium]|nr:hypothetical protein [Actinomycetota bacterium]